MCTHPYLCWPRAPRAWAVDPPGRGEGTPPLFAAGSAGAMVDGWVDGRWWRRGFGAAATSKNSSSIQEESAVRLIGKREGDWPGHQRWSPGRWSPVGIHLTLDGCRSAMVQCRRFQRRGPAVMSCSLITQCRCLIGCRQAARHRSCVRHWRNGFRAR